MQNALASSFVKTRFDGYSVHFSISIRGEQIRCAISLAALDSISGDRRRDKSRVLANFSANQAQIHRIAQALFMQRPESVDGTIRVWENDVEDEVIS